MNFQECELGFTYIDPKVCYFFGKRGAGAAEIAKKFSHLSFYKIKQTHSDIIIQASPDMKEADAHWTCEKGKGLMIATADCTPVLIYNKKVQTIAAIHAGWRGVANQIVFKTLNVLKTQSDSINDFEIAIGPHILQNSFEVHRDVLNQLLQASYAPRKEIHFIQREDKYLVDLQSILESQIEAALRHLPTLHHLRLDTKTTLFLNSFRRDKENSERNLSFIALNN